MITAAIFPYRKAREWARERIVDFIEVYVRCPLEVCAERDVKGLYRKAFPGEIPQLREYRSVRTSDRSRIDRRIPPEKPSESAAKVIQCLESLGYLPSSGQTTSDLVSRELTHSSSKKAFSEWVLTPGSIHVQALPPRMIPEKQRSFP